MSFDNSRSTFDPWNDYFGVVMEQGRVQLDSDWNEWLAEFARRIQAGTLDTIGRAVYPANTPYAFQLIPSTDSGGVKHLGIGAGRFYLDGLLVENHGTAALAIWDPGLAELSGAPQIQGATQVMLDFTEQPYLPGATLPAGDGPFLAYLVVWPRDVNYLLDPDLVDKAVGVDTTGRVQTAWQVRLLDVSKVAGGITCATPDSSIPEWQKLIEPSAAQLTTGFIATGTPGPCCLTPNTGYTGVENQFYRVEIHRGGLPATDNTYPLPVESATATFKVSRDNASVETGVSAIASVTNMVGSPASALTVMSIGRDDVLGFKPGNWIEIIDDVLELNAQPGELHLIDSIDFASKTITLDSPVSATTFPVTSGLPDGTRHTRIRRWDQAGKVYQSDGTTLWVDLSATGATGDIPVPPAGTTLILENGITVSFDLDASGGDIHVGDYWNFAARTADGSVDPLTKAYPSGIHRHYARLGVVTFPSTFLDCRVKWPPASEGECCDCTYCITQEQHDADPHAIQVAINKAAMTGGTVCLAPGVYSLRETVQIDNANSIRVRGHGWTTWIEMVGTDRPAIEIMNSNGVVLESVTVNAAGKSVHSLVAIQNSIGITIQNCLLLQAASLEHRPPGIGLAGFLIGVEIRENAFITGTGIGHRTETVHEGKHEDTLLTAGLAIEGNYLNCDIGITLDARTIHFAETRIVRNAIEFQKVGIAALGWVLDNVGFELHRNQIRGNGIAILAGVNEANIASNVISPMPNHSLTAGIAIIAGVGPKKMDHCQIMGNRISGPGGSAIDIDMEVAALMIKQNVIEGTDSGISMMLKGSADVLSIENNQLLNIAPKSNQDDAPLAGIRIQMAKQADIAGNTIRGLGQIAKQNPSRVGILAIASSGRIAGNTVSGIGPEDFIGRSYSAGIEVQAPFGGLEVTDNTVLPGLETGGGPDIGHWYALRVRRPAQGQVEVTAAVKDKTSILATESMVTGLFGTKIVAFSNNRPLFSANGNMFEARGDAPAVDIATDGAVAFSDNRCLHTSQIQSGVVNISAGSVIAIGNHVEDQHQSKIAMTISAKVYTVLGNITSGQITVNGPPLGDPWAPLNVIGS